MIPLHGLKRTLLAAAISLPAVASATPFTSTSPTDGGFDVTSTGASTIGGIVADFHGVSGAHLISQLSASSLFEGFNDDNPQFIGSQSGFGASITNALGGGISEAAFRFTLDDGDTAAGDFDENANTLLINGINFGDWTPVQAENTTSTGGTTSNGFSGGGFRNNLLDTGWFFSNDATLLSSLYTSIVSTESLTFELQDIDPGDNYLDFTQGIDASLIDVGQGPSVTPPSGTVPVPATLLLTLAGFLSLLRIRRKA